MSNLQTRLESLLVAGRKSSIDFDKSEEQSAIPSGLVVFSGAEFSRALEDRLVIGERQAFAPNRRVYQFSTFEKPRQTS